MADKSVNSHEKRKQDNKSESDSDGPEDHGPGTTDGKKTKFVLKAPMRLMDALSKSNVGNTPRPNEVEQLFIQGMRKVQLQQYQAAVRILTTAVQKAQVAVKSPKAQEIDLERMGCCCMGLGYLSFLTMQYKRAESMYRKSLQYWSRIHGKDSPNLVGLLGDLAVVHMSAHNLPLAYATLQATASIVEKQFGQGAQLSTVWTRMGTVRVHENNANEAIKCFEIAFTQASKNTDKESQEALLNTCILYSKFLHKIEKIEKDPHAKINDDSDDEKLEDSLQQKATISDVPSTPTKPAVNPSTPATPATPATPSTQQATATTQEIPKLVPPTSMDKSAREKRQTQLKSIIEDLSKKLETDVSAATSSPTAASTSASS